MATALKKPTRTIEHKLSGYPLRPDAAGTLIKPSELIDLVEVQSLSLTDWRIYNQLLANAWTEIGKPVVHSIHKSYLKGARRSTDRLSESLNRLMGAIAVVKVKQDGEPSELRVQLLGANLVHDRPDGYFYYTFPDELRRIIIRSTVFARIRTEIMYAMRSKYALRLFENVQKRGNLRFKNYDEFTIDEFRNLIGVPKKKLKRFADLNKYAIQPALREVNELGSYSVWVNFEKEGRKVVRIILGWMEKNNEGKLRG